MAFVVAGTHSGCGKTTLSLALMAALKRHGMRVQAYKVGPDFIDPGFHTQITGTWSRNLDGWMLSRRYNIGRFQSLLTGADVAVVEGVMGLYDGYDGVDEAGSTAQMANWLDLPVVLVVDARSMARSVAALLLGYVRFDPNLRFAGVIFNRIGSPAHLTFLKESVDHYLPGLPVLGGIPRDDGLGIPERHLGLVTADEISLPPESLQHLADVVDQYLDWSLLVKHTRYSPPPIMDKSPVPDDSQVPVPIAVARDAAFCFYYPDNLDLLKRYGAKLMFFSPLAGQTIPNNAAALYLGGGYPEVHAKALSKNKRFFDDLRKAVEKGMPVYAECGGLMALSRAIETVDKKRYPMAGLLPFTTRMLRRRKALGYTEVQLRHSCLLGMPGMRIRGHEFHYSEIAETDEFSGVELVYTLRARKYRKPRLEGYSCGSILASYVHLHWGSNLQAAANFVNRARRYLDETGK